MKQSPQKPSSVHPGLQLIDARIRLAQTPESDTETRRRRQDRVEELEKRSGWQIRKEAGGPLSPRDGVGTTEGVRVLPGVTTQWRDAPATEIPHQELTTNKLPTPTIADDDRQPDESGGEAKGFGHEHPAGPVEDEPQVLLTPSLREATYREVREEIKNTDQKAMFCLVAVVWLLIFLINRGATTSWFYGPTGWLFKDLVSFLAVSGLVGSAYLILKVLSPSKTALTPQEKLAVKHDLLERGFGMGTIAAFLALVFLIITKRPHPPSRFY